jgi:phosphate starvation-inducible PhoH-like protein
MGRKNKKQPKRDTYAKHIEGKTQNQEDYIRSICENTVIFCCGPAGSGKSFISAGISAEHLIEGKIRRIMVSRPLISAGKGVGFLPGELDEKIAPYNGPMEDHFIDFFGYMKYKSLVDDGQIVYSPVEFMRGATFRDTYMIMDEAQNFTFDQIKMYLTRVGYGSKILVNGDIKQTDLMDMSSGLSKCMSRTAGLKHVAHCTLTRSDIQRHSIIGPILAALEADD